MTVSLIINQQSSISNLSDSWHNSVPDEQGRTVRMPAAGSHGDNVSGVCARHGYGFVRSDGGKANRDFPSCHNRCGIRRERYSRNRGKRTAVAAVEWLCSQPRTGLRRFHRCAARSANPASPAESHREARSRCGTQFSPSRHQGRDRLDQSDLVPDRLLEPHPRASRCDARSGRWRCWVQASAATGDTAIAFGTATASNTTSAFSGTRRCARDPAAHATLPGAACARLGRSEGV